MAKENKKSRVEEYLNDLMESEGFTIEDLIELTVDDLLKESSLEGIGKITLSSVLSDYKSKYEEDFFKDIDNELMSDFGETIHVSHDDVPVQMPFSIEEVQLIKKMIQEKADIQSAELMELKLALKNAGIDYQMILKDYRIQKELEIKEWEDNSDY